MYAIQNKHFYSPYILLSRYPSRHKTIQIKNKGEKNVKRFPLLSPRFLKKFNSPAQNNRTSPNNTRRDTSAPSYRF